MTDTPKKRRRGKYLRKDTSRPLRRKAALANLSFFFLTLIYLELILHVAVFGAPQLRFGYVLGFSAVFSCVLAILTSFLPKKAHFPVTLILTVLLILLYGSQFIYFFNFGTLYSVSQMQMGGAAITSFWRETLTTMLNNILWLLVLFLPLISLLLLRKFCRFMFIPTNAPCRIVLLLAAIAVQLIMIPCLRIGGTGYFTNYHYYHNSSTTTDQAADRFGLLTAFRLDLFSPAQTEDEPTYYIPEATQAPVQTVAPTDPIGATLPTEQSPETMPETVPPTEPEFNIINIDFDMLNEMTGDKKLRAINDYCASLSGTRKNAYTGMLSDYNLIVLCGESFATGAIHPEATPTLYKMATEGIIFNNFYNSFPNNTIDGEYALCMGLFPDTSRNKNENSFLASRLCYLPFCLGNAFAEQKDVQSYGYHNNNRNYYSRGASHPNLGYKMKFSGSGMNFSSSAWPKSDLEMFQQSIDDYISADQFHAYYMTFSGHMQYNVNVNGMAAKNYDVVKDLPYCEEAKCYIACHVELDNALALLMQRLEEEGIADKTAIVLVGDHYPYGLTDAQYSELVGYDIDDFSKYKSSLLFWVGGLDENIVVDEYCCNVDVLPTILNLWGFEYDSRMLAGTDVFSDGDHTAIRIDKSFYNDKVWVNTNTGEIRYQVDENELPTGYVENLMKSIETKFSISADILNKSYNKFVFKDGAAAVNPTEADQAE